MVEDAVYPIFLNTEEGYVHENVDGVLANVGVTSRSSRSSGYCWRGFLARIAGARCSIQDSGIFARMTLEFRLDINWLRLEFGYPQCYEFHLWA